MYKENEKFLLGFETLKIPVIENGIPTWGEKFSLDYIEKLRRKSGELKFLSQMMLEPVDLHEHRFSTENLIFYDNDLDIKKSYGRTHFYITNHKITGGCCWWDPALATGGDNSVIGAVFIDENKKYYLHDILYIDIAENKTGENLAIFQCKQVIKFMIKNFVSSVYVESNGLGKFLPEFLTAEIKKLKLPIKVIAINSTKNKETRIVEAFDAVISCKYLSVHERVKLTPFLFEYENWHIGTKTHDDGMDAVAGCLSAEPFFITAFPEKFFLLNNYMACEKTDEEKITLSQDLINIQPNKNYKVKMTFSPLT